MDDKKSQSVVDVELSLCYMDGMREKGKEGIKTNFGAVETDKAREKYTQKERRENEIEMKREREKAKNIL